MARVKKEPKCSICRKVPKPDCDYKQGRCPHTPSLIDQILSNPEMMKFLKENDILDVTNDN